MDKEIKSDEIVLCGLVSPAKCELKSSIHGVEDFYHFCRDFYQNCPYAKGKYKISIKLVKVKDK